MSDVPTLKTERLVLRPVRIEDADAYFEMRNDTEVARYLLRPPPRSVDEALASLKRMESVNAWALTRAGEDKLLGTIGLPRFDAENRCTSISFELRRDEWGKGLMGEAAATVIQHTFEVLKVHRIQAEIDPKNAPSIHLAETLGFVTELEARSAFERDMGTITQANYLASQAAFNQMRLQAEMER